MLIDEIIALLSDENSSLSGALLKTSVLLHRLGKKDLATWVKYELEGYPDDVELPPYRILPVQLLGNAANIAWKYEAHPLPTSHLNKKMQEQLKSMRFSQSLNSIEGLASVDNNIIHRLPPEIYPSLSEGLANGLMVTGAWLSASNLAVKGMLMQIRAKLLDFLLNLKDSLGDDVEENEMKKKAENIDTNTMFNNAIFGANTTVILGSNNNTTISNVIKHDFKSLSKQLTALGVPSEEIKVLKKFIDADVKENGNPSLEGKTGGWLTRMLAGAKKGTLGLTVESVSGGVTRALLDFIG